jgi:hypothetical protein
MKKLVLIILIAICSSSAFSQSETSVFPLNPDTGEIYYSEVINVEGKTKDDLFLSAKTWFVNAFKSSNDVIQLNDKEEGVIIGKGLLELNKGIVNFSVKLSVKEERYKYEIYDLIYESSVGGYNFDLKQENPKGILKSMWVSAWKKDREATLNEIHSLKTSLIKEISSNKIVLKKDTW